MYRMPNGVYFSSFNCWFGSGQPKNLPSKLGYECCIRLVQRLTDRFFDSYSPGTYLCSKVDMTLSHELYPWGTTHIDSHIHSRN